MRSGVGTQTESLLTWPICGAAVSEPAAMHTGVVKSTESAPAPSKVAKRVEPIKEWEYS